MCTEYFPGQGGRGVFRIGTALAGEGGGLGAGGSVGSTRGVMFLRISYIFEKKKFCIEHSIWLLCHSTEARGWGFGPHLGTDA